MSVRTVHILRVLVIICMAAGLCPCTASGDDGEVGAEFEAGGKSFVLTTAGLGGFRAGFSATVEAEGRACVLDSSGGEVTDLNEKSTEPTPYGEAAVRGVTVRFENERMVLLFRIGRVRGVPGVLFQAGVRNVGSAPVKLLALSPITMEGTAVAGRHRGMEIVGSAEDWLITGLQAPMQKIVDLSEIQETVAIREAGGFYRKDGVGFLFGPVGAPVAYVNARISPFRNGGTFFNISAEMSGVVVAPGETRWGQQVALLMEPAPRAVARWAEWVGRTHGARTSKGALSGWNNWNFRTKKNTEKELLNVAEKVQRSGGRLRPGVVQIDNSVEPGHAALDAPWLKQVLFRVTEAGSRLGVRLDLERNSPGTQASVSQLAEAVAKAVASGFSYLKLSVPRSEWREDGCKRTSFEIYRDEWAEIREAAGEDAYLLCANTPPDRAVIGSVDACRTGPDASRLALRKAMMSVLSSYALNGRWFAVDNDVYYMAGEIEGMCSVSGGWPVMQTWLSMVGMSCGAAITSEPFYWGAFGPHLRNMEVLTPPASEHTELPGLFTRANWSPLVGRFQRGWGDATVALLWNSHADYVQPVNLNLADAGLDPGRRYAVWSFWDNHFLGVAKGTWSTPPLLKGASQHLRFTEIDPTSDRPVLVGSNLHIYCGAAEIKNVISSRESMHIELNDAGARAGELFIHSRWEPLFKAATGCAVGGIFKEGENVWKISISDRQHNVPQQVDIAIMLPVTRQTWFWLLMTAAVACLLFTLWRYYVGLRQQQAHALERERARIARDLHDDLGAGLNEIALLSEVVRQNRERKDAVNTHAQRIFHSASEMTQALDEIVWAINPTNDTLEKLLLFISEFARAMLDLAGIRCRLDMPDAVPDLTVNSPVRHQLCMALKECLTNAIKHSRSDEIEIQITFKEQVLCMTVADNGTGFDHDVLENRTGSHDGLDNLQRRMADIGGTCKISSMPNHGTRVMLQVKL